MNTLGLKIPERAKDLESKLNILYPWNKVSLFLIKEKFKNQHTSFEIECGVRLHNNKQ